MADSNWKCLPVHQVYLPRRIRRRLNWDDGASGSDPPLQSINDGEKCRRSLFSIYIGQPIAIHGTSGRLPYPFRSQFSAQPRHLYSRQLHSFAIDHSRLLTLWVFAAFEETVSESPSAAPRPQLFFSLDTTTGSSPVSSMPSRSVLSSTIRRLLSLVPLSPCTTLVAFWDA